MDFSFPYNLYTDEDPYYRDMPAKSPFSDEMPTSTYWKDDFQKMDIKFNNPIPFKLYSDEDPYYTSMPAESTYRNEFPTSSYWYHYNEIHKKREIKTETKEEFKLEDKKEEFRIGRIILMHLGGSTNPEFMNQQDTFTVPKDLNDGAGLAYELDENSNKYRPDIQQIQERNKTRFVPHEQKVDIIDVTPSEFPITEDQVTTGPTRSDLGHSRFCDRTLIETLFKKKDLFKTASESSFTNARKKANPYESIHKAIFLNRAAVKMANLDFLYNLTNTPVFEKPTFSDVAPDQYFYFADICAGPGGFTDYLYWRVGEHRARGFGMTLAGDHDWAPEYMFYSKGVRTFIRHYGSDGTGNIFLMENLQSFQDVIKENTRGEMVSLVTADGGIAVDGEENDQERLLKRLVLCQFLCALLVLRKGGNFLCKVFDVFTDFSSSLLYVVAQCFEKFSIVKPYTSRPANNERYVVFLNLREQLPNDVISVLAKANDLFDKINLNEDDLMEVFPIDKLPRYFADYLENSNEKLVKSQIEAVDELICFIEDSNMKPLDQEDIARRCLKEWRVPRNKMEDFEIYHRDRRNMTAPRHPQFQQQQFQQPQFQQKQFQQKQFQQQFQQQQFQQQQFQQQQKQIEAIEDDNEEREEEVDKSMTVLGSIILSHKKHMKQQKGEIVHAVFSCHEKSPKQSPTFFSFV